MSVLVLFFNFCQTAFRAFLHFQRMFPLRQILTAEQ